MYGEIFSFEGYQVKHIFLPNEMKNMTDFDQ